MAVFGITKRKAMPIIKLVGAPVVLLVFLVILYLFLVQVGYRQISTQIKDFKEAREREEIMKEKVEVLRQMRSSGLEATDLGVIILPDKNPGLSAISQLKRKAQTNDLQVSDLNLSRAQNFENDITQMQLGAVVESEETGPILDFLRNLDKLAPIVSLDKTTITTKGELVSADFKILVYWSGFPDKLPSINEPINRLSQEERNILGRLSEFERPQFTEPSPTQPGLRTNPFN